MQSFALHEYASFSVKQPLLVEHPFAILSFNSKEFGKIILLIPYRALFGAAVSAELEVC